MSRSEYRERLAELRTDVRSMGLLAVDRFEQGVEALQTGDRQLAREVIEGDHELNDLYLELESDCVDLIALQQPVASDLRLIASSFKVLTDLERIGDLATNLARYGLDADGVPATLDADAGTHGLLDGEADLPASVDAAASGGAPASDETAASADAASDDTTASRTSTASDDSPSIGPGAASGAPGVVDVEPLADLAAEMVRDALDAYATDDAGACRAIADRDDDLDEQCRRASATVVRNVIAADPATTTGAEIEAFLGEVSTSLLTIRDVERVGDHAVNVAARTLYQVENEDELLY